MNVIVENTDQCGMYSMKKTVVFLQIRLVYIYIYKNKTVFAFQSILHFCFHRSVPKCPEMGLCLPERPELQRLLSNVHVMYHRSPIFVKLTYA